jgi:clan AA aspartic protease
MTQGTVHQLQARVNVTFRLPHQPDIELEFVVDTGFEGALTLPPSAVRLLGLPFFQEIDANLADDTDVRTPAYIATILWNGREIPVAVLAMGRRPLLGTALLEDLRLTIDFTENGDVTIQTRP